MHKKLHCYLAHIHWKIYWHFSADIYILLYAKMGMFQLH
jgi:hypothetical protein